MPSSASKKNILGSSTGCSEHSSSIFSGCRRWSLRSSQGDHGFEVRLTPYNPLVAVDRHAMSHADCRLLVLKGARFLGELSTIRRYAYWSDRRIRDIAADNPIDLDRRWRTAFRTPLSGSCLRLSSSKSAEP
jgi:hypothetical protein